MDPSTYRGAELLPRNSSGASASSDRGGTDRTVTRPRQTRALPLRTVPDHDRRGSRSTTNDGLFRPLTGGRRQKNRNQRKLPHTLSNGLGHKLGCLTWLRLGAHAFLGRWALGCAVLFHPSSTAISGGLAIWLGLGSALAQESYRDPSTAEGWALPQIERSEMADFNERCNTPALDPNDEQDARWRDDCRTLPARFLQDLLTRS